MKTIIKYLFIFSFSFAIPCSALSQNLTQTNIDSTQNAVGEGYPILKPLKGGPLRILLIGPASTAGLLSAEISKRLDSESSEIYTGTRDRLGFVNNSEFLSSDYSDSSASFRILAALGKEFDVIMIDFLPGNLPSDIVSVLRRKIAEGTGLVCIGSKEEYRRLNIQGISKENKLNAKSYYGSGNFSTGKIDKGKVVIIPGFSRFVTDMERGDWFNNIVNLILYSSGRLYGTELLGIDLPTRPVEHEVIGISNYMINFTSDTDVDSMKVIARYRNESGKIITEISHVYQIKKGRSFVLMNYPQIPIGKYSVDVTAQSPEGVIAFAGNSFKIDSRDKISDVRLWNTYAKPGGFFTGTISASFEFKEGIVITAELEDYWGRTIGKYTLETITGRKSVDFIFSVKEQYSKLMTLKVKFYKNNELVNLIEKEFFLERNLIDNDFYLGILDSPLHLSIGRGEYNMLREAGTDFIAPDFSGNTELSQTSRIVKDISSGNMDSLPVLASLNENTGVNTKLNDKIKSLTDTLKNISPYGYSFIFETKNVATGNKILSFMDSLKSLVASVDSGAATGSFDFSGLSIRENRENKFPLFTTYDQKTGTDGVMDIQETNSVDGLKGLVIPSGFALTSDESIIRRLPWLALIKGYNTIWYEGLYGEPGNVLAPGLSLSQSFNSLAEECGVIKKGIDRIILKSSLMREEDSPVIEISHLNGDKEETGLNPDDFKVAVYSDREAYYAAVVPGIEVNPGISKSTHFILKMNNFKRTYFVYDVLNEKFFGASDKIEIDISKKTSGFFALLPYRVRSLDLSIPNSVVDSGGEFRYSLRIIPQEETAKPARHVVLIDLIDPSGKLLPIYSKEAEVDDWTYENVLSLTKNENPGRWILRVKDVISGKIAERAFVIKPAGMVR